MSGLRGGDVAVVIPTISRNPILARTLAKLSEQTVRDLEIIVVVDGEGHPAPPPGASRVIVKRHGGAAAARNAGVRATERPLVLFLDDDMLPDGDLVERHLEMHNAHPERTTAILGRVDWHPEVAGNPVNRWLDWSNTQFAYEAFSERDGEDIGWHHLYSCNVSLHRDFFLEAGGFDERFIVYYEDTDLGLRLGEKGLHLYYQPRARAWHLQKYDFAAVRRRFDRVALGERLMIEKHPGFEPFFLQRMQRARASAPRTSIWPHLVERVPRSLAERRPELLAALRRRASLVYYNRLADSYEKAYERGAGIAELQQYLGDEYDPQMLLHHTAEVDREAEAAPDEQEFYRSSRIYLYDLTMFATWGTKDPYVRMLLRHVPEGGHLLDYGCGIGADGVRLMEVGYRVSFADFDNPSVEYLRWRLKRRGLTAAIYDVERDEIPGGFDAAYSFDVIEHVEDPAGFLDRLEQRARVVAVNLLAPEPGDTHLHHELPIAELRERAARRGLLTYRVLQGRSHLLIYRGTPAQASPSLGSRAAVLLGQADAAARAARGRLRRGG